jgi:outer membrane protein OmpA-like peptidoglycan-associated protein
MASDTPNRNPWLALIAGAVCLALLGLWGIYAGPHSAAALRKDVESKAANALAVGGNGFAVVTVEDGMAVLSGVAPSAAARDAALAAVTVALQDVLGLPGVIAGVEDRLVIVEAQAAVAPPAPPPADGMQEAALPPGPDADECEEAFQRTIEGRSIGFVTGGADILAESHPLLDELAAVAQRCAAYVMTVEGHTDVRGDAASNKALSQRRAQAVVDYLVGKGAPADALTAKGLGEEQVLDTSETPEGHARNRRTEFKVAARPS